MRKKTVKQFQNNFISHVTKSLVIYDEEQAD